jgi:hypothetical protein
VDYRNETEKALRSLPWYLAFAVLFGPLVAALFTGGWSLFLYFGYFSQPSVLWIPLSVGGALWLLRQFWRFAAVTFVQNRRGY